MILTTDRLRLRQAEPDDVEALHKLYSDPGAMRYWSTAPDATVAQTRDRVASQFQQEPVTYFVFEKEGEVIGNGGHFHAGEIGYILRRDHWQQGLSREAFEAIIPHVFAVTDYAALRAEVDPRNLGSVALLTRLGFQVCGFAQKNFPVMGELLDSAYFSLQRPEQRPEQRPAP